MMNMKREKEKKVRRNKKKLSDCKEAFIKG